MKKYTKVSKMEIIKEYDRLDLTICDICGDSTKNGWKDGWYDAHESEISMKTGFNYPEGGSGVTLTFDICPKCFTDKLIPWVKSFGGEPTVKEWDW